MVGIGGLEGVRSRLVGVPSHDMTDSAKNPRKKPAKKTGKKVNGRRVSPKLTDTLSIETLFEGKKPTVLPFKVSMDSTFADRAAEAKEAYDQAQKKVDEAERVLGFSKSKDGVDPELLDERDDAQDAYEEAQAESDARSIEFVFRALARPYLMGLYKQYPPTDRQRRQFRDELKAAKLPQTTPLDFNEDTFPPVIIHKAMLSPELSQEQVDEMWYGPICEDCEGEGCDDNDVCVDGRRPDLGVWSRAELDDMFLTAVNVNKLVK